MNFSKCTPNGPSLLANASLVTRRRPKAGGRVLKCSWFVIVIAFLFLFFVVDFGLPILHFGR